MTFERYRIFYLEMIVRLLNFSDFLFGSDRPAFPGFDTRAPTTRHAIVARSFISAVVPTRGYSYPSHVMSL